MKNKLVILAGICLLLFAIAACGSKENGAVPTPTEAAKATVLQAEEPASTSTQAVVPTAEPTATSTPMPEPTATPTSAVQDTYQPGTVTEDKFTSKWMNLRFTRQKGFELGTEEGLEMYAQCVDGARLEVYTELLSEEYMEMQEVDYLTVLEKELNKNGFTVINEPDIKQGLIGKAFFTGVDFAVEDENGQVSYASFALRKKESRMIVLSLTMPCSDSACHSYSNLINSFGEYYSNPIILPEEQLALVAFDGGVFTENSYENEWMNLRITVPEGATLTKRDYPVLDTAVGEIQWEVEKLPYIQYGIQHANNRTADDYLLEMTDYFKDNMLSDNEGWVYTFDEQIKTELLGGQEYVVMTAVLSRPERENRTDEYYCRVQDNYALFINFQYEKEQEEQIKEAKSLITEY